MAKKQTRRSISVRGVTYAKLRDYCAGIDLSMSDFVEQRIAEFFAAHPAAATTKPVIVAQKAPVAKVPVLAERARVVPRPTERPVSPIRAVPAKSVVVVKPAMPTAALRVTAPSPLPAHAAAAATTHPSVGRPAPTPASQVLKTRASSNDRDVDYRAIRF